MAAAGKAGNEPAVVAGIPEQGVVADIQLIDRIYQHADMGFEVEGRITEFLVTEGEFVENGAVLARLDVDAAVGQPEELDGVKQNTEQRVARFAEALQQWITDTLNNLDAQ